MTGPSADARRDLPLAAVAATTTWLTMLSWRGFSELWGAFLGPLILVAVVVAVAGVVVRAARIPRRVGMLLHAVVVAIVVWILMGGSPLHPVTSGHRIVEDWSAA